MTVAKHKAIGVSVRRAQETDLPIVMALIEAARAYFKHSGIDQWQDGYPDSAAILCDQKAGNSFVVAQNGRVVATFMAAVECDPNYAAIEGGSWQTSGAPYAVLHRIAVDETVKGSGVGASVVQFIAETFAPLGIASIRCDTHADNTSMCRMLEKNSFVRCGVIHLANGAARNAFEKTLPHADAAL